LDSYDKYQAIFSTTFLIIFGLLRMRIFINNAGWAVGYTAGGLWVWNKVEGSILLQHLLVGPDADLWDLSGWGREAPAYSMCAVHEPATMILLGSGLPGLWGAKKQFKK
jgi:hypothetical protein